MSVQYTDGTFGETLPIKEAMEKFKIALESGTAKALHVGSPTDIDKAKQEYALNKHIAGLEQRVRELESAQGGIVRRATLKEIQVIAAQGEQPK